MKKKVTAAVLSIVLAAGILAGCGQRFRCIPLRGKCGSAHGGDRALVRYWGGGGRIL